MPFIEVPITSDAESLVDGAMERLQEQWTDWVPNDADLEVILIEALGPIAQDALEVAASVPESVFRQYGTELVGEAYQTAQSATGAATFLAVDSAGYDSADAAAPDTEGLVQIAIGGVAFETDEPVRIAPGSDQVTVAITATDPGAAGNDLTGTAELITALAWVDLITVDGPTANGIDGEDDEEYVDRLSDALQLRAKTLVTGRDFEIEALQNPQVGRAVAIVGTARQVTVAITDPEGEPTTQATKDAVEADYDLYRQVNTTYSVVDPTYTDIDVSYDIVILPGYDIPTVQASLESAVAQWLDPFNWGRPLDVQASESDVWVLDNTVRYNELVRVISVAGVRYVRDVTLDGGRADVALPGTVALTRPGTIAGTVGVT